MATSAKDKKKARQMAEAIGPVVGNQEVRDFKHALGVNKSVRLRQGWVFAMNPAANDVSLWLSGEETTGVDGVRYFDVLPAVDYAVWCATDGEDIFIIASQGPAPVIKLSKSATQTITTGTPTNIVWQDPSVPANNGFDYWQAWTSGDNTSLWLPAPGVWELSGICTWNITNATGYRIAYISDDGSVQRGRDDVEPEATGHYLTLNPQGFYRVTDASNAWVTMIVHHSAGVDLTTLHNQGAGMSLTVKWLGLAG